MLRCKGDQKLAGFPLTELTVWSGLEWRQVPGQLEISPAPEGKVCRAVGAHEGHTTWISGREGFFFEGMTSMLRAKE